MDYFGLFDGAEGESRTPTPLPELDPEPSVSTNSTTSARKSVYRIRPPAGKLFFRFFPFFYFNKQNRDDKRQHSQAPGDCCPSCRQRIRKTRRPADNGRDGCRPRNSPASRHRGRPAMYHDGICAIRRVPPFREICWKRGMEADKSGWHLPSPCAGSRFFADWRPGQGRKNARNPHAQHCPPAFPAHVLSCPCPPARGKRHLFPPPAPEAATVRL